MGPGVAAEARGRHRVSTAGLTLKPRMDLSLRACWDCPVPLGEVLLLAAVLVGLAGVVARLRARGGDWRSLGTVLLVFTAAVWVAHGVCVSRWGIRMGETGTPSTVLWGSRAWLVWLGVTAGLGGMVAFASRWLARRT